MAEFTFTAGPTFALPPPQTIALPVQGSTAAFPVGRVFCIGRNYPWGAGEADTPRALPAWFMKPASAVVAADGVLPYLRHAAVWLAVNGDERQRADVAHMLWPVSALVSMLSRSVTLAQGDLIFTGTPAGVGPLVPDDEITAGVTGIGQLSMTVGRPRSDPAHSPLQGTQGISR